MQKPKLIRLTAHDKTLGLLKGQINFISNNFEILLVANDTGRLKEIAEREGVEYKAVNIKREISLSSDIKSLFNLIKLFKKEKPDIVHANTPKGALLAMLAAKITRVPNRLYNVNGLRFETTQGKLRKLLITMEKIACACATKVIPQSNGVANVLRHEKITKKPLEVILNGSGNGVDLTQFNPEDKELISSANEIRKSIGEGINFIFVGRLVGDKGVNELVESFSKLSTEQNNVNLILVGGTEQDLDPIKPETLKEIERNERIHAVGFQKDVRPYLLASDVFVLPSYREGFPNVVLEASAMGLPCIVSDVNGATDAIKDGMNGFVIPKRDSSALYNAMKMLSTNEPQCKEMAGKARPFVAERFNRPDVWKATLEMYKSLQK